MDQESISQTALDQMVSNDRGQLLKAAVPYLSPQGQRMISIFSKLQELRNTIALFSPSLSQTRQRFSRIFGVSAMGKAARYWIRQQT